MKMGKAVSIFLLSIFFVRISYSQVNFTSSNLPIVLIVTEVPEIPNEPKIPATMRIVDNGPGQRNEITGPFNDFDGNIGIEIRGSSSRMFEKKSYGIEIWDENQNDTIASILGMPEEEDWVLHGPYSDKSLMRNVLTFKLGSDLGRYASRTRFVELVLNNDYRGVYVFMEKIKRDRNRVDIADLSPEENTGDDLTGGYIVKLDKFDGSNTGGGWASPYRPPGYTKSDQRIYFQFDYPKSRNITPEQAAYIENYVTAFEDALQKLPASDLKNGYKSFIDLESFVDFAIINELSRNVDGYRLSTFLHKDKDSKDGKLYIGPIWDFNLAFGNADYYNGSDIEGWGWNFNFNTATNDDFWLIPFWWQRFQTDPEYLNLLKNRWQALRSGPFKTETILNFIDSTAAVLEEAQSRNFLRFRILSIYIWPNAYVGGSYANEIEYLKDWIVARINWLDQAIDNTVTALPDQKLNNPSVKIIPNPFDDELLIQLWDNLSKPEIIIHNILGEKIIELKPDHLSDGDRIYWNTMDWSGKHILPGIYILILKNEGHILTTEKILKY
jgi:hypothetical protein